MPFPRLISLLETLSSQSKPAQPQVELKLLAPGNSPVVDIIAIHGLDGDLERSWTADNSVMWLSSLLPTDIPNARIFTYGYNAATSGQPQLARWTMEKHAEQLISEVVRQRESDEPTTSDRPIIFIAHSMGGIVLKFALILSNLTSGTPRKEHQSFAATTAGILFIGTPHQGTGAAEAKSLVDIYSIRGKVSKALRKDLQDQSELLQGQLSTYNAISSNYRTKFYHETYRTKLTTGQSLLLVPPYSAAVPGAVNAESIGLAKDHVGLIRFTDKDDSDYVVIMEAIELMIQEIIGESTR